MNEFATLSDLRLVQGGDLRGKVRRVDPLTESEHAIAEQLSRRLHSELRGAVALLPLAERGASAMSRWLSIDRATCQRIVGAISRPDATSETLVQLPGVEGLRQFANAMAERYTDPVAVERLAAVRAAIDRFESVLAELGGSQRRLKERLDAGKGPDSQDFIQGPDSEKAREALFRAAVGVMGRWSALTVSVGMIRPLPDDPLRTDSVRVLGSLGHRWREPCIPLEVGRTASLRPTEPGEARPLFATLDGVPILGATPGVILDQFCSNPAPQIIAREIGRRIVNVIDTPEHAEQPLDIFTGTRTVVPDKHPATLDPAIGEVWALQHIPARHLVFDTYLHRDIARRCIPSLEAHLWRPDVTGHAAARWSTRLPGGPRLEVLGSGLAGTRTQIYPRMGELLEHVYSRIGWDPEEFIGYRCEVSYPLWRAGYCMLFDFTGNEMGMGPSQVDAV